jgi:hypothetical protein
VKSRPTPDKDKTFKLKENKLITRKNKACKDQM